MGHLRGSDSTIRPQEQRWAWRAIAGMRGRSAERATRWLIIANSVIANMFGAAIVFALLVLVLEPPEPSAGEPEAVAPALTNLIIAVVFVVVAAQIGTRWALRRLDPARDWLIEERRPTEAEQRALLRIPLVVFAAHAVLWSSAAILFAAFNVVYAIDAGASSSDATEQIVRIAVTIVLGGLGTATFAYLVAERLQRPIAARALSAEAPVRPSVPGIKARSLIAWGLGAGLPTAGIVMIGISRLTEQDFSGDDLAVAAIVLGSLALILGLSASLLAARAVADPVASVRAALAEVEAGNLDVEVPIYDGSEIGMLQSGFNRMVAGVRDRERLNDLFGRHVGEEVARAALEGEIEMGGEVRDVAVLFVDIVGSTRLATERSPGEVVEVLNSFFGIVVEVIDAHGGWINKFIGDAALAIFGAPSFVEDSAGCALASGRVLAERLSKELGGIDAGIGISYGKAVAGNIGEERRYEYTVIGDPVNEAARLSELAKERPLKVLASSRALEAAGESDEATGWELADEVELRGRGEPTQLAVPKG